MMCEQDEKKTVLVVDDDAIVRETLQNIIASIAGATSIAAERVSVARRMLADRDVDLVITDLSMPGETGLAILGWIRDSGRATPVIIFSGSLTEGEELKAHRLGVDLVLAKPGDVPTLRKVICGFLGLDP